MAVHDRPWRHHDLGTLGRLDRRARLPVTLDELVQSLLPRLGRRMALPVPARHRPGAVTAGFGQLLLRPHPGGSLDWARGSYESARGTISAGWKRDRGRFTYWAELPPNVTATIRIPSRHAADVRDAVDNPPLALASFPGAGDAQEAVFQVGSGAHEFSGPTMNDPGSS